MSALCTELCKHRTVLVEVYDEETAVQYIMVIRLVDIRIPG